LAVITVDHVSKVYRLYDKPIQRLKEALSPFHKELHNKFYALNDINFSIDKGEFVGIIGVNGSGKSTILKIITGVLTPSDGKVVVDGRISALLELGSGFNPDYTGMENLFLNGSMMGYTRAQMEEKVPTILDFADIGDYVHQPVKTYSSGMFVRLAFALAINVEPEILIVDEALAVGDVFFQAKCYKRINEICKSGTTIILVTHDMSSVLKYCNRVIVLNKGAFIKEGSAAEMVDIYKKILVNQLDDDDIEEETKAESKTQTKLKTKAKAEKTLQTGSEMKSSQGPVCKSKLTLNKDLLQYGNHKAEIVDFGIFDHNEKVTNMLLKNKAFTIMMKVKFAEKTAMPIFAFTIKDSQGTELTGTNTMIEDTILEAASPGDIYTITFKQKMRLQGREYLLSLGCTSFEGGEFVVYDRLYDVANITVISNQDTVGIFDSNTVIDVKQEKKKKRTEDIKK